MSRASAIQNHDGLTLQIKARGTQLQVKKAGSHLWIEWCWLARNSISLRRCLEDTAGGHTAWGSGHSLNPSTWAFEFYPTTCLCPQSPSLYLFHNRSCAPCAKCLFFWVAVKSFLKLSWNPLSPPYFRFIRNTWGKVLLAVEKLNFLHVCQ